MEPLATVGELNVHVQREVDRELAEQSLLMASSLVRTYCNWALTRQVETLQVEGSGTVVLTLPTLRLNDVAAVRVAGVSIDLLPVSCTWTRRGQLIRFGGWPALTPIEVDCDHGYDPLPDVLKLVVLEMAARGANNPQGLVSATAGQVTRVWGAAGASGSPKLTGLDERLLDQFRL